MRTRESRPAAALRDGESISAELDDRERLCCACTSAVADVFIAYSEQVFRSENYKTLWLRLFKVLLNYVEEAEKEQFKSLITISIENLRR